MTWTGPGRPRLMERYASFLPVTETTPRISLGEGATPLVRTCRLAEAIGIDELYLKFEGMNPTGSFKDRGMVVAVAKALEEGARSIVCASTGNTSASAAAYGAAAGIEVVVLLPAGKIALGKLLQALVANARVVAVDGNFDEALRVVRELAEQDRHPVTLVNSVNPYRIEGQKTAAFEVVDDLGRAPDVLAIPVGNAGNITAYWAGFRAYRDAGRIDALPRMMGFQAAGAAPIVLGHPVEKPETVATAIRIGNPASWDRAGRRARRVRRPHRHGHRRGDPRRLPRRRPAGGDLLRAVVRRERRRRAQARAGGAARARRDGRLRPHRPRPQGPRHGGRERPGDHRGRSHDGRRHGRPRVVSEPAMRPLAGRHPRHGWRP